MRISVVGSMSIVAFVCSTSAWGAPDQAEPGPRPAASATISAAPAATAAPAAPAAAPAASAVPAAPTRPAAPAASAPPATPAPEPTPDAAPSPKQLTGPLRGPLPPEETALPPLPSSAPANYDAPPPPPPPKATRRSEWGVQLRFEGAALGTDAVPNAGMGGIGFSLRPRPSPYFAVDFGIDFIGGRDFNGDRRSESAFSVNPTLFLNPRNKVQVYLFAGLGVGGASVLGSNGVGRNYRYVGADAGGGLEFRLWRHFAFSGDLLAFVRDRADVKSSAPEYFDPATGRYTNSSAGALFRLGGTYYW